MNCGAEFLVKYFDVIKSKTAAQVLGDAAAEDLNLQLLFLRMDFTRSKIGQQYFYANLRLCRQNGDIFKKYREFFRENPAEKSRAQSILSKLNHADDSHFLDVVQDDILVNETHYRYARFSFFATVFILVAAFFLPKILLLLFPLVVGNLWFHYSNKNYVEYYNTLLSRVNATILAANGLAKNPIFAEEFREIKLAKLRKVIRFIHLEKLLAQDELLIIFWLLAEIFRIIFSLEIFAFRKRVRILNRSKADLLKLFEFVGKIDTAAALAEIQENFKTCTPIFIAEKSFEVKNIYHPLIENCVENSLTLRGESAVITGSNMSGKTSFMRNIAVNVLFAQNFGFCFADFYAAPKMQIFTSISVQDDISESKSYYLEEVLRIKNFLEPREGFALILIDEIFKGTNTKERIAISKAVLQQLNSPKNLVFVTTHDLEIATFLQQNKYELYNFEEEISEENLSFPYQLKRGINQKTNAIKILSLYNYPENIIRKANDFLE